MANRSRSRRSFELPVPKEMRAESGLCRAVSQPHCDEILEGCFLGPPSQAWF